MKDFLEQSKYRHGTIIYHASTKLRGLVFKQGVGRDCVAVLILDSYTVDSWEIKDTYQIGGIKLFNH